MNKLCTRSDYSIDIVRHISIMKSDPLHGLMFISGPPRRTCDPWGRVREGLESLGGGYLFSSYNGGAPRPTNFLLRFIHSCLKNVESSWPATKTVTPCSQSNNRRFTTVLYCIFVLLGENIADRTQQMEQANLSKV